VKLSLYLDENAMARPLVAGLRARGVDVQTVNEAGLVGQDDKTQLQWATSNNRAIYTLNVRDFCQLHRSYMETQMKHAGIIVVPRHRFDVKQQIRLLSDLVSTKSAEDMRNWIEFL
jgi:hypothetical protein